MIAKYVVGLLLCLLITVNTASTAALKLIPMKIYGTEIFFESTDEFFEKISEEISYDSSEKTTYHDNDDLIIRLIRGMIHRYEKSTKEKKTKEVTTQGPVSGETSENSSGKSKEVVTQNSLSNTNKPVSGETAENVSSKSKEEAEDKKGSIKVKRAISGETAENSSGKTKEAVSGETAENKF